MGASATDDATDATPLTVVSGASPDTLDARQPAPLEIACEFADGLTRRLVDLLMTADAQLSHLLLVLLVEDTCLAGVKMTPEKRAPRVAASLIDRLYWALSEDALTLLTRVADLGPASAYAGQ